MSIRTRLARPRWRVGVGLVAALTAGTLLLAVPGLPSGSQAPGHQGFQYSAKYLCGFVAGPVNAANLAPGEYRTEVNIHNPHSSAVRVAKKVVQSPTEPETGRPSRPVAITLGPDEAVQVDCKDVEKLRGTGPLAFEKGFVVVSSASSLDVVDVMTVKEELVGAVPRQPGNGGTPGLPFQLSATFTVSGPSQAGIPYPVDGESEITTQVPVSLPSGCAGERTPMTIDDCPLLDMVKILRERLRAELLKAGIEPGEADRILAQQKVDYKMNQPVSFSSDVSLDFEYVPAQRVPLAELP